MRCCEAPRGRARRYKQRLLTVVHVLLALFLLEMVVMGQLLRGAGNAGEEALRHAMRYQSEDAQGFAEPGAAAMLEEGAKRGAGAGAGVGAVAADAALQDAGVALGDGEKRGSWSDGAGAGTENDDVAQAAAADVASRPSPTRERFQRKLSRHRARRGAKQEPSERPEPGEDGEAHVAEVSPGKRSAGRGPPPSAFWRRWRNSRKDDFEPDPEELAARPLLHFVMIVKDESASIAETVDSVKPYVDHYTILDTGSTDGTQDIIHERFGDVPGEVFEEEFTDFSSTRNRVIELAGLKCVFVLMLSGDESLRLGSALRNFLEEHRSWDWVKKSRAHEAYNMQIKYGTDVYDSTRIHRSDAAWFYVGVTHEYMTNARRNVATMRVKASDGVVPYLFHDLSNSDPAGKRRRWKLDLELLSGEWDKKPNTTRTAFYIGQTYECLRDYPNAYKWYKRRFDLGGWHEEAYEARFRMGRVSKYMKHPWPEVQQHWLDAHAFLPSRAEPLYAIANHYFHREKNYALAFLFAQRAAQLPFPAHLRLFIDKPVYDFKAHDLLGIVAFYVGEYDVGERAVRKALSVLPNDRRLTKNLGFYQRKREQIEARRAARRARRAAGDTPP